MSKMFSYGWVDLITILQAASELSATNGRELQIKFHLQECVCLHIWFGQYEIFTLM